MNKLTDIKIEYQRLIFRLNRRRKLNQLEKAKRGAVREAVRLKNITGKQHKVLFIEDQYVVKSRRDLIELNKMFPRLSKLNVVEIDKLTVYTTK
jgi:hypothetical protein